MDRGEQVGGIESLCDSVGVQRVMCSLADGAEPCGRVVTTIK